MIGYQKTELSKDEWLTPPQVLQALGEFDLDPCSPVNRPWPTAKVHYTVQDNGLLRDWFGRVFLNPPYSRGVMGLWMNKMVLHGDGIALVPARTETEEFQQYVFGKASSVLFLKGRLYFHHVTGERAAHNSGGPTVLVAYGEGNSECLETCGLKGKHVLIDSSLVVMCGYDQSWRWITKIAMIRLNSAGMDKIYGEVEKIAPEKIRRNKNYKAKIRQMLQRHFRHVGPGQWSLQCSE